MKTAQVENIAEVWEDFFKAHEECCRNLLLEHYLPLVKYTAERIYAKLPDKVELDDLHVGVRTERIKDATGRRGPIVFAGRDRQACEEIIDRIMATLSVDVETSEGINGILWS